MFQPSYIWLSEQAVPFFLRIMNFSDVRFCHKTVVVYSFFHSSEFERKVWKLLSCFEKKLVLTSVVLHKIEIAQLNVTK